MARRFRILKPRTTRATDVPAGYVTAMDKKLHVSTSYKDDYPKTLCGRTAIALRADPADWPKRCQTCKRIQKGG